MLCYESSAGPQDKEARKKAAIDLTEDHLTDSVLQFVYPDGYLLTLKLVEIDEGVWGYDHEWFMNIYPTKTRCAPYPPKHSWGYDHAVRTLISITESHRVGRHTLDKAHTLVAHGWAKLIDNDYQGEQK